MKERIFTAHELKVWNEHFGEYDMNEIIRLKRQYLSTNYHGLKKPMKNCKQYGFGTTTKQSLEQANCQRLS